jgi:CheY-like chemotaxis protein
MKKIAIIEDNPDNRLLVCTILEDDYRIFEYASGSDALKGVAIELPDLFLIDISLPGMDGLEVLNRLRSQPETKEIPAIALTAHAMVGDREKFLLAGFQEYVSKPIIDETHFLKVIRTLLQKKTPKS